MLGLFILNIIYFIYIYRMECHCFIFLLLFIVCFYMCVSIVLMYLRCSFCLIVITSGTQCGVGLQSYRIDTNKAIGIGGVVIKGITTTVNVHGG